MLCGIYSLVEQLHGTKISASHCIYLMLKVTEYDKNKSNMLHCNHFITIGNKMIKKEGFFKFAGYVT